MVSEKSESMSFAERYGPWAVIAGASEGTGRCFALKVAAQGVQCVLLGRRAGPLTAVAEEVRAATGVTCITASIDLAAPDATERLIDAVGEREIGLFISNAGSDYNGSHFLDCELENWLELVRRNVVTTLKCCHHFGALMRTRQKGGLLLVNSGVCYGGGSFMSVYSASKAFTLCLGETLWAELKPHGVDVLNLVLGRTDTPALRALLAEKGLAVPRHLASPDAVAEGALARLPHGPTHNWGFADDVKGFGPTSPDQRRARIIAVDAASKDIFGDG